MIRDATLDDLESLLLMGSDFFDASGYGDFTELNLESLADTFVGLIENEAGVLLVGEINEEIAGMAAAILYPHYFNQHQIAGQEMFWWVKPEHRRNKIGIELLQAMESQAADKGATTFSMMALQRLTPKKLNDLYLKLGYDKSEHVYIKRL